MANQHLPCGCVNVCMWVCLRVCVCVYGLCMVCRVYMSVWVHGWVVCECGCVGCVGVPVGVCVYIMCVWVCIHGCVCAWNLHPTCLPNLKPGGPRQHLPAVTRDNSRPEASPPPAAARPQRESPQAPLTRVLAEQV